MSILQIKKWPNTLDKFKFRQNLHTKPVCPTVFQMLSQRPLTWRWLTAVSYSTSPSPLQRWSFLKYTFFPPCQGALTNLHWVLAWTCRGQKDDQPSQAAAKSKLTSIWWQKNQFKWSRPSLKSLIWSKSATTQSRKLVWSSPETI